MATVTLTPVPGTANGDAWGDGSNATYTDSTGAATLTASLSDLPADADKITGVRVVVTGSIVPAGDDYWTLSAVVREKSTLVTLADGIEFFGGFQVQSWDGTTVTEPAASIAYENDVARWNDADIVFTVGYDQNMGADGNAFRIQEVRVEVDYLATETHNPDYWYPDIDSMPSTAGAWDYNYGMKRGLALEAESTVSLHPSSTNSTDDPAVAFRDTNPAHNSATWPTTGYRVRTKSAGRYVQLDVRLARYSADGLLQKAEVPLGIVDDTGLTEIREWVVDWPTVNDDLTAAANDVLALVIYTDGGTASDSHTLYVDSVDTFAENPNLVPGAGTPSGTAVGSFSWTGVASGSSPASGQAAGSFAWSGTATGSAVAAGTAVGTFAWSGTATGDAPANSGTAAGTFAWSGSASGRAAHSGSAAGSFAWTGQASGTTALSGAARAGHAWTGTADGNAAHTGSATGSHTWTGTASGAHTASGTATGGFAWAGAASGSSPHSGSATGSFSWTGTAVARNVPNGTAVGGFSWTGQASGSTAHAGSASGGFAFSGQASGSRPSRGTAAAKHVWSGVGSGSTVTKGTAATAFAFTGTAVGSTAHRGTAVGTFAWTGTATAIAQRDITITGHTPPVSRFTDTGPAHEIYTLVPPASRWTEQPARSRWNTADPATETWPTGEPEIDGHTASKPVSKTTTTEPVR